MFDYTEQAEMCFAMKRSTGKNKKSLNTTQTYLTFT